MATYRLSEEELSRYLLLPHDHYYCELGLNDQTLNEIEEQSFEEAILKPVGLDTIHHNFLKWSFALLKNRSSKKRDEFSQEWYEAQKVAFSVKNFEKLKVINVQISGFYQDGVSTSYFLPIMEDAISTEILNSLIPYFERLCSFYIPKGRHGRPKGSTRGPRDEFLHCLAFNLIKVLGCSLNRSKEILFNFGVLLNYWKAEQKAGTYEGSQMIYQGKMVNKFFPEGILEIPFTKNDFDNLNKA